MNEVIHIDGLRVAPHVRDGKPTGSWLLDIPKTISRKGRRQRRFFANRELAIRKAKAYLRAVYSGASSQAFANKASPSAFLFKTIEEWGAEQKLEVAALQKRQSSLIRDFLHFGSFKVFCTDILLSEITERKLKEYVAWRIGTKRLSPATVKTDVVAIGKVLRWAVKTGRLASMPPLPKVKVPRRHIELPTPAEIERIIACALPRNRMIIRVWVETGCRRDEILNLRKEDMDWENCSFHVRSRDGYTTKTEHSERTMFIRPETAARLRSMLVENSMWVFPSDNPEKRLGSIRRNFRTAVKNAAIMRNGKPLRITPQTFRKGFASWGANEQKMHPAVLKRLMGHSPASTVTDEYYIKVSDEALRLGVRAFAPSSAMAQSGNSVATDTKENGP